VEDLLAQGRAAGPSVAPPVASAPILTPSPAVAASSFAASVASAESAAAFPPPIDRPDSRPTGPRTAFEPAEPDPGGAYLGFADLAIGEEETVVRDRYDEVDTPPTPGASPSGGEPGETMEGFVSGYDMPASAAPPSRAGETRVPAPISSRSAAASPAHAGAPAQAESGGEDPMSAATLSAETLDRLADLVVRRMSERVVREIAWEVIPGVAESVVRERIKELEEREG
jgi:hypothetical protein